MYVSKLVPLAMQHCDYIHYPIVIFYRHLNYTNQKKIYIYIYIYMYKNLSNMSLVTNKKITIHTFAFSLCLSMVEPFNQKFSALGYFRYLKKNLLTSIFYHTPLWVQTPIRNTQNDLKIISVVYLFCT